MLWCYNQTNLMIKK